MGIFFSTVTSLSPLQSIRGENSHSHDPRSPELCSGGGTKSSPMAVDLSMPALVRLKMLLLSPPLWKDKKEDSQSGGHTATAALTHLISLCVSHSFTYRFVNQFLHPGLDPPQQPVHVYGESAFVHLSKYRRLHVSAACPHDRCHLSLFFRSPVFYPHLTALRGVIHHS